MGEKIIVGPFGKGLTTTIPPFYIDNDAFPKLINAFQHRARVKRKRGTSPICRLQRYFNSTITSYGSITSFNLVAGAGNLLTAFNLEVNGNIVPGTVSFLDSTSGNTYTDPAEDGTLVGAPGGSGTINYATGDITVAGGAADLITTVSFNYFPDLPVMDIEDLNLTDTQFPQTLSLDTVYSYQIVSAFPYYSYDVSFYKNPTASALLPGYVPKATPTPIRWHGQNYQQFWSTNYENALWATNGITIPFSTTNVGMQFKFITNISAVVSVPNGPSLATFTIGVGHGLVVGDFVFINELPTTGGTAVTGLNLQTGYVTAVAATTVTVEFPNATLVGAGGAQASGILQYLTSSAAFPAQDCIRWYDGDPTSGTEFNPTLTGHLGWVNFCPPIYNLTPTDIPVVETLPAAIYYLVGARMIVPYKDRLLFLGPVIQSTGSIPGTIAGTYYLQDTIIYSQNGTPYYTASFTGSATSSATQFFPILTPVNEGAAPNAYFADVTGYGGYITAGYQQPITTVGSNQDTLIVGFTTRQTKVIYTGNDLVPFNFYIINSELGATATFSSIILDRGVITFGDRGITITDQQSCARIDLQILDQVFELDLLNRGTQRITAQRDFVNEWVYFSYPFNNEEGTSDPFPNQTLFYNYREGTWAIFNESYTTYGPFRRQTGFTWATVGSIFSSWNAWNQAWNASSSSLLQQEVIAGNQQGFVIAREDVTTSEAPSLYIQAIDTITMQVTSPNHGLATGDFVYFLDALGMTNFNSVPPAYILWQVVVVDVDTFKILPDPEIQPPLVVSGTYLGNGTITRLYIPQIQTKQFPTAWEIARKTRIGPQQYLFTTTPNAQLTLQIFLSQNAITPFNSSPYVPDPNAQNDAIMYSNVLYTCQESTNLGLTPANSNLQQVVPAQAQTWHRMNTSLLGDTVQVGFTLSDKQMFDSTLTNQIAEIELHGLILDVAPSQVLA